MKTQSAHSAARAGTVYLVGAGPGDPGLMTARALELIATADAILYDRLIPPGAVSGARADALVEYVGKRSRGDSDSQAGIDARLVELALEGKSVVRLKGGDPFVFGRGGEEALAVANAGLPFEVVPGVTAGVAASAYAGIPITQRKLSSAVAFVTGSEDPSKPGEVINWPALAGFPGTLVFYMGIRNLAHISGQLVANGRNADEPVAVIEQGTTPAQRTVTGTLGTIVELVSAAGIKPPALTVVGAVVELNVELAWYENRPLFGTSVAVTRARNQASTFARRLSELGAAVVETPTIRIEARNDAALLTAILTLGDFDLVCFTSVNGVECLFKKLLANGADARIFAGAQIAVIGKATAAALAEHGLVADVIPDRATAEGLLESLPHSAIEGRKVMVATAANARPTLVEGLTARNARVEVVELYDTVAEPLDDDQIGQLAAVDIVTFASGSAVRALTGAIGETDLLAQKKIVSIGPITSSALVACGLQADSEADPHDIDGLVDAVLRIVTSD